MFAAVELLPRGTRLSRSQKATAVQRVPLANAFSFYRITLKQHAADLPWRRLSRLAGPLKTRLLLPDGWTPPANSGLTVFHPQKLPVIALVNAAAKAIAAQNLPATKLRVAVIDEAGVAVNAVEQLAPSAASLTVVTKRRERYLHLEKQIMSRYGISLLLTAASARLCESTVLIAPDAAAVPLAYDGLLLTNTPVRRMNATVRVSLPPVLPPGVEALRSPGIDPLLFASALFECCANRTLETLAMSLPPI